MITAQQPWSLELVPSLGTTATRLKDASGNVIALFNRYEDAEAILELIKQKNELPKFIENVITLLENDMIEVAIDKLDVLT